MKRPIVAPLILVFVGLGLSQSPERVEVRLQYGGERQLDQATTQLLSSLTLELVGTSQFNSVAHQALLNSSVREVHRRYRATVGGNYLLTSFEEPRAIETRGGKITMVEVVIGLNHRHYADSIFTIDDEGRVVEHAKYQGSKCVELLQRVRTTLGDA